MSFFTGLDEAERYARNRPYFHPRAIARAQEALGIEASLPVALDVACGTGQSTAALLSIAERAIGLDISPNMLAHAVHDRRIQYLQATAEALPIRSGSAPLLSTALAFHWFDRERFLSEAWRVLGDGGALLVYSNGFTGIMREAPAFQEWSRTAYLVRFPIPPRDSAPLTAEGAAGAGFEFLAEDVYENDVVFSPEALVAYLATQTNVKAALDEGRESLQTDRRWLLAQVRPYFAGVENATFVFRTRAWYLRKSAGGAD